MTDKAAIERAFMEASDGSLLVVIALGDKGVVEGTPVAAFRRKAWAFQVDEVGAVRIKGRAMLSRDKLKALKQYMMDNGLVAEKMEA